MKATTRLRQLLARPGATMAPGVSEALGARLVARHGFEALYMTGAGSTAARLGMPDVGLMTMTEMVDNAARIVDAASGMPLIADADNGYGGVMNVRRTIRAYERAGVASVHLEDQVIPKRCGHLAGKQVVPEAEMVSKLKAALDSRTDPDFLLIARTDAIAVEGFERAIERANLYRETGADMIFIDAPSGEQIKTICSRVGAPVLFNCSGSGKTPILAKSEIEALGFKLVIYPTWTLMAAIRAMSRVLETLKATGSVASLEGEIAGFREMFDLVGMPEVQELEARWGVAEAARARY
jgi:2-methylisocitrate lyase-like PEP mutase family enzyme